MAGARTIDIHTHVLTEETMRLLTKESPKSAVVIAPIDKDSAMLTVASTSYKPFPRGGWDIERRLRDMDAAGVDVHVLSATPQTYLYGQDIALTAATAAIQNEQIGRLVRAHPARFMGIATLPMQDAEKAAAELRRGVRALGLRGAMIGSNVNGRNLDDPGFEPLWAAAEELDALLFIHPVTVAGAERLKSYYLVNLIGNPADTTIAAACLLFGGVLDRHPRLKILLAHGGGFVPYQAGRWTHGWRVRPEPKKNIATAPENIIGRFLYDTLCHSRPSLEFLIVQAGCQRVLLGSDYPYDMGMPDCVKQVRALAIPVADRDAILGGGAEVLLSAKQ